jgi:hypothetical protein
MQRVTSKTKRVQAPGARRCKGRNKRGEPCAATAVGAGGYCVAHDPESKVDMRALGSRGGRSRRRGVAEQLPEAERESLRQYLRDGLDRDTIKAAIERSLAGDNESARVACVKFLSDLELYRQDGGECPRCAEARAEAEANYDKNREAIIKLVLESVVQIIEADPHPVGLASMAAAYLDERQQQRIAELRTLRLNEIRESWVDDMTREALAGA